MSIVDLQEGGRICRILLIYFAKEFIFYPPSPPNLYLLKSEKVYFINYTLI